MITKSMFESLWGSGKPTARKANWTSVHKDRELFCLDCGSPVTYYCQTCWPLGDNSTETVTSPEVLQRELYRG